MRRVLTENRDEKLCFLESPQSITDGKRSSTASKALLFPKRLMAWRRRTQGDSRRITIRARLEISLDRCHDRGGCQTKSLMI